jgi:hypothetical protein
VENFFGIQVGVLVKQNNFSAQNQRAPIVLTRRGEKLMVFGIFAISLTIAAFADIIRGMLGM